MQGDGEEREVLNVGITRNIVERCEHRTFVLRTY